MQNSGYPYTNKKVALALIIMNSTWIGYQEQYCSDCSAESPEIVFFPPIKYKWKKIIFNSLVDICTTAETIKNKTLSRPPLSQNLILNVFCFISRNLTMNNCSYSTSEKGEKGFIFVIVIFVLIEFTSTQQIIKEKFWFIVRPCLRKLLK